VARAVLAALLVVAGSWAAALPARATVFYARDEVDGLAFPDADSVKAVDFFLKPDQRRAIEARAGSRLDSDIVTVSVGRRDGAVLGYAIIDSHVVRTLPESLLVVLTANGSVEATYSLAFYEPLEYLASKRWLAQLDGRGLDDGLRIGRDIAAITGSTLTSRAVVGAVRRALAIYQVLLHGGT
jgi:hypothetical protein